LGETSQGRAALPQQLQRHKGFDTRQFGFGASSSASNPLPVRTCSALSLGAVVFLAQLFGNWSRAWTFVIWRQHRRAARIDAPRSSGEALFSLDIGVPLTNGGSGAHGPGITITTGQAIDPFVGPFDLQSSSGPRTTGPNAFGPIQFSP
jgi:hypothetical protein